MKWLKFKEWVERQGVTDESDIFFMDFHNEPNDITWHNDGSFDLT